MKFSRCRIQSITLTTECELILYTVGPEKKECNEKQTKGWQQKCSIKNAKNYEINLCFLPAFFNGGNSTEFFGSCYWGFFSGFSLPFPVATCRCGKLSLCMQRKKP